MTTMKTFKQHFTEATMQVPPRVLDEIRAWMRDTYEDIKMRGVSRIREIHKGFDIDLTGTKYEYLQPTIDKYPLTVTLSYAPSDRTSQHYMDDTRTIRLNLGNFKRTYDDVLEHEFVHYLQDIMYLRVIIAKKQHPGYLNTPGGMKRKLTNQTKDMNFDGQQWRKIGDPPGRKRRTSHHLRPVEHQSNLVSTLKELVKYYRHNRYEYEDKIRRNNEYKYGNEHHQDPKLEIFKAFVRDNHRMKKLKKSREGQYKEYIKQLYKAFIHTDLEDLTRTYNEAKDFLKRVEVKLLQQNAAKEMKRTKTETPILWKYQWDDITGKQDIKLPVFEDELTKLNIEPLVIYDWDIDSTLKLHNKTMTDHVLSKLGWDINATGETDEENHPVSVIKIPFDYPEIKQTFKKIKELKDDQPEDLPYYYKYEESIDNMAKELAKYYSYALNNAEIDAGWDEEGYPLSISSIYETFYEGKPLK
jgi:hypothetical protein